MCREKKKIRTKRLNKKESEKVGIQMKRTLHKIINGLTDSVLKDKTEGHDCMLT